MPIKRILLNRLALFTSLILLYACTVYDIETDFIKKLNINYQFKLIDNNKQKKASLWYQSFNNPELEKLIKKGFQYNYSLKVAWQNLSIAQLKAQNSGANIYPSLRTSSNINYSNSTIANDRKTNTYSLSTNWEIDLWGRIQAIRESEKINYDISQLELINTALLLSTNIAQSYYNLIFLIKQKKVLEKQIIEGKKVLEILTLRKLVGQSSLLEIGQQEQIILSIQKTLTQTQQDITLEQNLLQSLLGKIAGQNFFLPKHTNSPIPPIHLFSKDKNLFKLNPRLQASLKIVERNEFLRAAQLASRFPTFSINANYGINSTNNNFNLSQPISSISTNIVKNIWDSGIEKRNYNMSKKKLKLAILQLSQDYINTIRELENNLITEKKIKDSYDISIQRLALAKKNLQIAQTQYFTGTIEYLSFSNSLNSLFTIELEGLRLEQQLFSQRINLYRIIGGNILLLENKKNKKKNYEN